jgi:FeS assembly SUF system regulator
MFRVSRLTDYGVVLMSAMAAQPDRLYTATDLAADARLPLPTVSKLLRLLARRGLLVSHRGVKGGYSLARSPEQISLASVIGALEGPISLTICTGDSPGECSHEPLCPVRSRWQRINLAIRRALGGISLSDMVGPLGERSRQVLGDIEHRFSSAVSPGWNHTPDLASGKERGRNSRSLLLR